MRGPERSRAGGGMTRPRGENWSSFPGQWSSVLPPWIFQSRRGLVIDRDSWMTTGYADLVTVDAVLW